MQRYQEIERKCARTRWREENGWTSTHRIPNKNSATSPFTCSLLRPHSYYLPGSTSRTTSTHFTYLKPPNIVVIMHLPGFGHENDISVRHSQIRRTIRRFGIGIIHEVFNGRLYSANYHPLVICLHLPVSPVYGLPLLVTSFLALCSLLPLFFFTPIAARPLTVFGGDASSSLQHDSHIFCGSQDNGKLQPEKQLRHLLVIQNSSIPSIVHSIASFSLVIISIILLLSHSILLCYLSHCGCSQLVHHPYALPHRDLFINNFCPIFHYPYFCCIFLFFDCSPFHLHYLLPLFLLWSSLSYFCSYFVSLYLSFLPTSHLFLTFWLKSFLLKPHVTDHSLCHLPHPPINRVILWQLSPTSLHFLFFFIPPLIMPSLHSLIFTLLTLQLLF